MPAKTRIRRKKYYDDYLEAATKQLSNSILNKIVGREKNIVNVVSLKGGVGKSMVVEQIAGQFSRMGRKFRIVNWYDALKKTDREIMYPINYSDILSLGTDKIIIIEHRNLSDDIIQTDILQNAVLNILILNARSSWKDTDSIHYKELVEQIADSKNLLICLVDADKLVVEEFTGQLPPYNFFSNLSHDIYNFGITSGRN